MKSTTYKMISGGQDKPPLMLSDGEFRTHFGKNENEAFAGLADQGRPVRLVTFLKGETARADVSGLTAAGIMTDLDASFRPAGENQALNAIASVYQTEDYTTSLAILLGGDEDLREWIGSRQSNRLQGVANSLTTKLFEMTWDIHRTAFEDDKSGMLRTRINAIAGEIQARLLGRVVAMYNAMPTTVHWLDGEFIVDTDHDYATQGGYATAQSNESNSAVSLAVLEAAYTAMMNLKGFNGFGRFNHTPTAVLCNPTELPLVYEVFTAPFFHAGTAATGSPKTGRNWIAGKIAAENIIAHSGVTAGDVYLIRKDPVAPVIILERSDVPDEFVIAMDPNTSDMVRDQDMYRIAYRRRHAEGYGHWADVFGIN